MKITRVPVFVAGWLSSNLSVKLLGLLFLWFLISGTVVSIAILNHSGFLDPIYALTSPAEVAVLAAIGVFVLILNAIFLAGALAATAQNFLASEQTNRNDP